MPLFRGKFLDTLDPRGHLGNSVFDQASMDAIRLNDKGMILNNLQLKPARNTSCFYAYFDGIIIP